MWLNSFSALSKLDAEEPEPASTVSVNTVTKTMTLVQSGNEIVDVGKLTPSAATSLASTPTLSNNDVINITDTECESDGYEYDVSEVCIKQFVMENDDILVVENKNVSRPAVIMQRPRYGSKKNIYEVCLGFFGSV